MARKETRNTDPREEYGAGTRFADMSNVGTEIGDGVKQMSGPLPEGLVNPSLESDPKSTSSKKSASAASKTKDGGKTGNGEGTGEGATPADSASATSTSTVAAAEAAAPNAS